MILHSTAVVKALEDYSIKVPEVPLRYEEDRHGIIVYVPSDFDQVPSLARAVAYAAINDLMGHLKLIQTNPRIKIGSHKCLA